VNLKKEKNYNMLYSNFTNSLATNVLVDSKIYCSLWLFPSKNFLVCASLVLN
jgi:hypothetical protein